MALSPEVLKWFYEAQKQLKERFDLDTSRKEDMGRLKTVHLYTQTDAGERTPLGMGEPIPEIADMVADARYATAVRAENGRDYAEPMPQSVNERLDWIRRSQRTFRVTEGEDGTLTMNSDMSDEELMRLYNEAKDGRLLVHKPGGDLRSNDGSGMFLCVDKDGMPAFCDTAFAYMKDLSFEQLEQFYQRHPEMLDKTMQDKDAVVQARIEYSELNRVENPHMIYDRIEASVQGLQSSSIDEKIKWWDEYENFSLIQLHAGAVPATYRQAAVTQRTIPGMLAKEDILHNFLKGEGLDKLMVVDENGTMPLFPDHKELKTRLETRDPYAVADVQRRLGEAALDGKLAYFSRDPENPGQYKGFHFAKNENGKLTTEKLPAEKPTLPWYKRWFSVFFRSDVAKYNKDTAAYEKYNSMKSYTERFGEPDTDEKQPEQEAPDPEKAARKAAEKEKLAKMTPEERFEYDVARQVADIYHKSSVSARIYLKMHKIDAEGVQKDPSFREFMQSEKMQTAMDKKLHGTEAEKKKIFPGILAQDYVNEVAQKVKAAARQQAAPKAEAPAKAAAPAKVEAPVQNTNQKKPQAPVMGGH